MWGWEAEISKDEKERGELDRQLKKGLASNKRRKNEPR